ncbi:exopolysaccharide biosynthesis polyprenyl glycosylphosphotransferase [Nocardioides sp. dk4132]|nr:exopolysaccharide biosynthesis polyprenyl glycosylphosphotransferase [Nocardioides sp. dk4132]QGA09554.1 exopolysaccharide biosynthesis polyprenyl glycosylphosphotransferase [Nocardioides sp. dk884]
MVLTAAIGVVAAARASARRGWLDAPGTGRAALTVLLSGVLTSWGMGSTEVGPVLGLVAVTTATSVLLRGLVRLGRPPLRVVLAGDAAVVARTALGWRMRGDVEVVGAVIVPDEDREPRALDTIVPLPVSTDPWAAAAWRADTVVLLPGGAVGPQTLERLCWRLESSTVRIAVAWDGLLDAVGRHRVRTGWSGNSPFAVVDRSRAPLAVRGLKAALDRLAGLALLGLAAPVLALLALVVRLDSPGPAFFRQVRVGRHGRPFTMYKLRTMTTDAEVVRASIAHADQGAGVLFKIHHDPRVTRAGRVLRRTSLDELPQLLNVLRGEMSLVGPRPALPDEVAAYDDRTRRRLAVRPGLTGLWQVSGRSDLGWEESVGLDLSYTDNVTLGRDLGICLRTVRAVTSRRGAY